MCWTTNNHKHNTLTAQMQENTSSILTTPNDFIVYFDFWHRVGLSPFKLSICKRTGACKTITNRKLLVWNFLVLVLTLATIFVWLCDSMLNEKKKNKQLKYFETALVFGQLVSFLAYFLTIWLRSTTISELVNMNSSILNPHQSGQTKDRWRCIGIIWFFILSNQLVPALRVLEREEWSFEKFFDLFIDLGREMMRWMPEDLQIISPTGETLLLLTGIFLHTLFYLIKAAMESLLVISAKAFISHLTSLEKRAKNMSANDGYKEYFRLKLLLQKNGKAVGLTTCGIVFGYLPMIVSMLPKVIQPNALVGFIESLFNSSIPILFLTFTSWLTNKANAIFLKLFTNEKQVSSLTEPHLSIIFLELGNGGLLFDSFGWIKLNPALLSEIICLTLTFAVVMVQVKTEAQSIKAP